LIAFFTLGEFGRQVSCACACAGWLIGHSVCNNCIRSPPPCNGRAASAQLARTGTQARRHPSSDDHALCALCRVRPVCSPSEIISPQEIRNARRRIHVFGSVWGLFRSALLLSADRVSRGARAGDPLYATLAPAKGVPWQRSMFGGMHVFPPSACVYAVPPDRQNTQCAVHYGGCSC